MVDEVAGGVFVVLLVGAVAAAGGEDAPVVEVALGAGVGGLGELEPVDHDLLAQNVHEVVVVEGLVDDVPVDQPAGVAGGGVGDARFSGGLQGDGVVLQGLDALGQPAPAGPDQHVAAQGNGGVVEPVQGLGDLGVGGQAVVVPLHGVFQHAGVEVGLQGFAVALAVGAFVEQASHRDGGAEGEGVGGLLEMRRRARHGPACRVGDGDAEVGFAVFVDAGVGLGPPGGVGIAAGVVDVGARQARHGLGVAVVDDREVCEVQSLAVEAQVEGGVGLAWGVVVVGGEGHVEDGPVLAHAETHKGALVVGLAGALKGELHGGLAGHGFFTAGAEGRQQHVACLDGGGQRGAGDRVPVGGHAGGGDDPNPVAYARGKLGGAEGGHGDAVCLGAFDGGGDQGAAVDHRRAAGGGGEARWGGQQQAKQREAGGNAGEGGHGMVPSGMSG